MPGYEETLVKAVWLMIHIDDSAGGTNKIELEVLDRLGSVENIPAGMKDEAMKAAESLMMTGKNALRDHVAELLTTERYGRKCRALAWMKRAALADKGVNHDEEALLDFMRGRFSIDWGDVTDYDAMIAKEVSGQKR